MGITPDAIFADRVLWNSGCQRLRKTPRSTTPFTVSSCFFLQDLQDYPAPWNQDINFAADAFNPATSSTLSRIGCSSYKRYPYFLIVCLASTDHLPYALRRALFGFRSTCICTSKSLLICSIIGSSNLWECLFTSGIHAEHSPFIGDVNTLRKAYTHG